MRSYGANSAASTSGGAPGWLRRALTAPILTTVAVVALAACGSSSNSSGGSGGAAAGTLNQPSLYGTLPKVGTPTRGGTITYGQITGLTPTTVFPVVPTADAGTFTYQWLAAMFLPLYNNQAYGSSPQINYSLSLANKPSFSTDDKTITITLKQGYKWSNGKPVIAKDLLFDIALIKAAVAENSSNWSAYTPGYFPDSLASANVSGQDTIVMHLNKPFNPGFFLNDQLATNLYPLPSTDWNVSSDGGPHLDWTVPANAKKIYDYLGKLGGHVSSFGSSPLWKIADGPFVISSFSPVTDSWTINANPNFGGTPKPYVNSVQGITYTGITPQLNAMLSGSLDIANLDNSQLADVGELKAHGYSTFALPDFGWAGAVWNFEDKTGHFNNIVKQLYFRQAMQMMVNESAIIQGVYHGAAGVAYGPVPTVPKTAYVPANAINPPYPYNPAKAVALLKSHGWHVVPNGTSTCQSAGSGPNQCGAGIPAGTPLSFSWATQTSASAPTQTLNDEAVASEAKQAAGINATLQQKTFNYISANYNVADPSVARFNNSWGIENYGGFTDSYYPTQNSIFNTTGSFNSGGFKDSTMDRLIKASVFGSNPNAVTQEAAYEAQALPVIWYPNYDIVYSVSNRIGGPQASYLSLTQYGFWPQFWWVNKK
jgi:peptide/nickel transport system substrate-binding protein